VGCSSVNCRLDFFKRRFKDWLVSFKMNIYFKERLKNLFRCISSAANSFFHLIKWILSSVEECLIHWPIVILWKFLNFFSWNWLHMLIKLIWTDCLNKIFYCSLNFIVLTLKFLRFNCDPLFLHLNKFVKSISWRFLR